MNQGACPWCDREGYHACTECWETIKEKTCMEYQGHCAHCAILEAK